MKEAIKRANEMDADLIDDIIVGDCLQCFDEANTARTAALMAGLPIEIPAVTIQRQCSSSMQALIFAAQQIQCGDSEVVLVVGVESMSSAPFYLDKARWGMRLTNGECIDAMWELLHSGSRVLKEPVIMGITAENLAAKYNISRKDQDQVALESHNKAEVATSSGRFKDETVSVEVPGKKGTTTFDTDEHFRPGLTMADLERLPPAFKKDGTVTAGNSSGAQRLCCRRHCYVKEKGQGTGDDAHGQNRNPWAGRCRASSDGLWSCTVNPKSFEKG